MYTNCSHGLRTIYGVEGFILYNLAVFIGYKIYLLCYDMAHFLRNGNLPVVMRLSVRKRLIYAVWGIAVAFYTTYISINFHWMRQGKKTFEDVQAFWITY